jgi:hypothetical protein
MVSYWDARTYLEEAVGVVPVVQPRAAVLLGAAGMVVVALVAGDEGRGDGRGGPGQGGDRRGQEEGAVG